MEYGNMKSCVILIFLACVVVNGQTVPPAPTTPTSPAQIEDSFNVDCGSSSCFNFDCKKTKNECRDIRNCAAAEASLAMGGVPTQCGWADGAARRVPKVCCGLPLVLGEELQAKVYQENLRNRECGQKQPSEVSETENKFNHILQSLPEDTNPPISSHNRFRYPVRPRGGKPAPEGENPWMVSIGKNGSHWCGGTLVNWTHILSAAHCFKDRDPKHYLVRLGSINVYGGRLFDVAKIVVHEGYVEGQYHNDIAMVTVSKEILDTKISRVCLPNPEIASMDLTGLNTSLLGWGDTLFDGTSTPVLHEVEAIPVTSTRACARKYVRFTRDTLPHGLTDEFICAGLPEGGKDACQKDSGGPLLYQEFSESIFDDKPKYLIGIVSFGYFCGEPGFPGVYTRVSSYMDWITKNMQL